MITLFTKKKISENKIANVFVNAILDVVENGFSEVSALINEDPNFVKSPQISPEDNGRFTMIVIAGNLEYLPNYFDDVETEHRVKYLIIEKFAQAFEMDVNKLHKMIKDYSKFMARVNHPSKNVLYSMSKAMFFKYELAQYQEDYFANLSTPNPMIIKRFDEVMSSFIWDWSAFFEKYKIAG